MKRIITIICDKSVPAQHLLNFDDYEIYTAQENSDVFTMVERKNKKDEKK